MNASLLRLWAIVVKELRQLRRDRLSFAMIAGMPILQLLLFGFAINMDVRNLDAALYDAAQTNNSRELAVTVERSQIFHFRYQVATENELNALLRSGRISAALVIPPDFERRLAQTEQAAVQLIVDGSDQSVQGAARQLASLPVSLLLRERRTPNLTTQVALANFYNPERRAPVNTVPGLIGVILSMTMVMFTAIALVREREHGNLEFLITTPLSPLELTLGKVVPYIGIGLLQTTLILILGKLIFAVPVRGSLIELYLAALLYIFASLALGIFISTMARTQFQAMQLSFFTFLPQILLSGFMFPFAGMPKPAQWLAELFPLTHFIRLIRGIMLRSAGIADLWMEFVALLLVAVVLLSIAVKRFHKRLD
jgi:ABC-2 type transport system permease protein